MFIRVPSWIMPVVCVDFAKCYILVTMTPPPAVIKAIIIPTILFIIKIYLIGIALIVNAGNIYQK